MAAVFNAQNDRFAVNPGRIFENKGERKLFGCTYRNHRADGKPLLGKVAHHAAVGGRKLDVNEAQRAFSVLRPALGLHSHGNTRLKNSNSQSRVWVRGCEKRSAIENSLSRAGFRLSIAGEEAGAGAGGISEIFHGRGDRRELLVGITREIWNGARRSFVWRKESGKGSVREIPRFVEGRGWGFPHSEAGQVGGRQIPLTRNSPGSSRSRRTTRYSVRGTIAISCGPV